MIRNTEEAISLVHVIEARLKAAPRDPAEWETLLMQLRDVTSFARRMKKASKGVE